MSKGKLVKFTADIACVPYCKGDVTRLTDEQVKAVKAEAKARNLGEVLEDVAEPKE